MSVYMPTLLFYLQSTLGILRHSINREFVMLIRGRIVISLYLTTSNGSSL